MPGNAIRFLAPDKQSCRIKQRRTVSEKRFLDVTANFFGKDGVFSDYTIKMDIYL